MKKYFLLLFSLLFLSSLIYAQNVQEEPSFTVDIENKLFSPISKAKEGVFFIPEIKGIKKVKLWFLTIKDENGRKVREFIGKKTLPEKLIWDGKNEKGINVDDGSYSYKFFVSADKREYVIEQRGIQVDTVLPFVSVKAANDIYFVDRESRALSKGINIFLSAGDESGIDLANSSIKVYSSNECVVKNFVFEDEIPDFINWDGKDDIYGIPLPVGNYKITFAVTDKAGNTAKQDTEISVIPMPIEPVVEEVEEDKEEELIVKQEERGLVINLSSKVLFDVNESDLKPEAEKSLIEVAEILRVYPRNNVLIEGYTDSTGRKEKNMDLSIARAQAVFDFFIQNGIDRDRMEIYGLGEANPIASNDTERGREQNRRVEVIILKAQDTIPSSTEDKQSTEDVQTEEKQPEGEQLEENLSTGEDIRAEEKQPEAEKPEAKQTEVDSSLKEKL